ncbi:Uu.00g022640.m01.CDS01 [Anthostomella pinea]|uniref:Uu.00g022640.m01.CDS01 n=1 Tax=Anthostomella pinea TaxID=933095 RepID=A0AAI8W0U0_9PEZI|nr:Uu.00g022640.m01.CDS01 [Anthostomella pinea]
MDPLSAIGLASGIITFIDFSWSLVTGTFEVYNSQAGTTFENVHIGRVIDDLREVSEGLEVNFRGDTSRHDKAPQKLAQNCAELSENLLVLLNNVAGGKKKKKTLWQSAQVKWQSMRRAGEVREIEERLAEYRSQILVRMNAMFSDDRSAIKMALAALQAEASALRSETMKELQDTKESLLSAIREARDEMDVDDSSDDSDDGVSDKEGTTPFASLRTIHDLLRHVDRLTMSASVHHRVLRQLVFNTMTSREAAIQVAENGTFAWMLEDDDTVNAVKSGTDQGFTPESGISELTLREGSVDDDNLPDEVGPHTADASDSLPWDLATYVAIESEFSESSRYRQSMSDTKFERNLWASQAESRRNAQSSLSEWLSDKNGVLHISGKAGSGKSTLLKYVYNHSRTQERLRQWAGSRKLVSAHFYFWISSEDELQKSLDGLYRSILFQVLSRYPELIPSIFPNQWQQSKDYPIASLDLEVVQFPPNAFRDAFQLLLSDECDNKLMSYWNLARSVLNWGNGPHVKVCSSSRPYLEFTETFCNKAKFVSLHEMTKHDIYLFSLASFGRDPNAAYIRNVYPRFTRSIVRRTDGVFLYAWHLLTVTVKPEDVKRLHLMLRLILFNPLGKTFESLGRALDLAYFGWLDECDKPNFPPRKDVITEFESAGLEAHCMRARRLVVGVSSGLLQVTEKHQNSYCSHIGCISRWCVTFGHRTFRDFLEENPGVLDNQESPAHLDIPLWERLRLSEYAYVVTRRPPTTHSDWAPSEQHNGIIAIFLSPKWGAPSDDLVDGIDFHDRFIVRRAASSLPKSMWQGYPKSMVQAYWEPAVAYRVALSGFHGFFARKKHLEPGYLSREHSSANLLICLAQGYEACTRNQAKECLHAAEFLAGGDSAFETMTLAHDSCDQLQVCSRQYMYNFDCRISLRFDLISPQLSRELGDLYFLVRELPEQRYPDLPGIPKVHFISMSGLLQQYDALISDMDGLLDLRDAAKTTHKCAAKIMNRRGWARYHPGDRKIHFEDRGSAFHLDEWFDNHNKPPPGAKPIRLETLLWGHHEILWVFWKQYSWNLIDDSFAPGWSLDHLAQDGCIYVSSSLLHEYVHIRDTEDEDGGEVEETLLQRKGQSHEVSANSRHPPRSGMLKRPPSTILQSRKLVSTVARTHQVDTSITPLSATNMSTDEVAQLPPSPLGRARTSPRTKARAPVGKPPPRQPGMGFFPLGYKDAVYQWWTSVSPTIAERNVISCIPHLREAVAADANPLAKMPSAEDPGQTRTSRTNDPFGPRVWKSTMVELSGKNRGLNEFSVERVGEPVDDTLVMLHGYGAGLGFYYKNFEPLSRSKGWKLYALDWLGMGNSKRPPFKISAKDPKEKITEAENWFVDALEEWRKIRNIDRFTIMGHSLGGYLAVSYALKYPGHINKLILASPVGVPEDPYAVNAEMPEPQDSTFQDEFTVDQQETTKPHENERLSSAKTKQGGPPEANEPKKRPYPSWLVWLWDANVSPFSIVRLTGPLGPRFVSGWTSRRFNHLPEEEKQILHDYAYSLFRQRGSGEYVLPYLLAPGAHARRPIINRIHSVGRQTMKPATDTTPAVKETGFPIIFMYGENDWMDVAGGLASEEKLKEAKIKALLHGTEEEKRKENGACKVVVVSKAGHHLYLDNPDEFNKYIEEELADSRQQTLREKPQI